MPANSTLSTGFIRTLVFAAALSALTLQVPPGVGPPVALAAGEWKFGEYTDFPPTTVRSLSRPSSLKLSRTAVQRSNVTAGESVDLIAEYSVPTGTMMVKETRTVYYNGQELGRRERVVSVPSDSKGTTLSMQVPANAGPGWYTVKTTVEAQPAVTTRSASPAAAPDTDQTTFNVHSRGTGTTPVGTPVQLKLWADKQEYKVGETLRVSFEASRDGYVTLVNVGTSGRITVLYPNAYAPDHAVKGGRAYSVPAQGDPYELTLSGPEGTEFVYAVFMTSSIKFAEANFAKSKFTVVNETAVEFTRDINVALKTIPLKEQADAALEINVTK